MASPIEQHPVPTQRCLSPSFWLGLFVILVVVISACDYADPLHIGVLSAVTFLGLAAVDAPLSRLRRLLPLLSFGVVCYLLLLIVPIEPDQPRLLLWGGRLSMPLQGAEFITAILIKSALIVLLATSLGEHLGLRGLLAALTGLRLPPKVVDLIYMIVNSIDGLRREIMRLVRARTARGGARGFRAVRVAAAMAQVLIIRIGRRAEWQAFALCSRGYAGRLPVLAPGTISLGEGLMLAIATAMLGALIWL